MALIQVRNVPEDVHETLTRNAKLAGKSLNAYMLELCEREAERFAEEAQWRAVLEKHRTAPRRHFDISSADLVRQVRDEREAELAERLEERARR